MNKVNRAYMQGRIDVINTVYNIAMNESADSLIEWLEDNLIDEDEEDDNEDSN